MGPHSGLRPTSFSGEVAPAGEIQAATAGGRSGERTSKWAGWREGLRGFYRCGEGCSGWRDKPYPRRRGAAVAACAHGAACLSEWEVRDDGSGWAPWVSDREEMSEGQRRAGERALALGREQAWDGLAGRGSGPAGQLASGPRGWVAAGPAGQRGCACVFLQNKTIKEQK